MSSRTRFEPVCPVCNRPHPPIRDAYCLEVSDEDIAAMAWTGSPEDMALWEAITAWGEEGSHD